MLCFNVAYSVADQSPKPVLPKVPNLDSSHRLLNLAQQYEEAGLWMRSSCDARGVALLERAEAIHQARLIDKNNAQVRDLPYDNVLEV